MSGVGNEGPDFNGLSEEGFLAGTDILSAWEKLDPAKQKEILPHLVDNFSNAVLADTATAEELRGIGNALTDTAHRFEDRAGTLERAEADSGQDRPYSYG